MIIVSSKNLVHILRNTLNHMDPRLMDHGVRVAFMVWKILEFENQVDKKTIRDITMIALLHDIGAYKTEEIDRMLQFETIEIYEHSIYGYLFVKYLSPLVDYAKLILYHHMPYQTLKELHLSEWKWIQLITLCDRFDVFMEQFSSIADTLSYLDNNREKLICSEMVDILVASNQQIHFLERLYEQPEPVELEILYQATFQQEEIYAYLRMYAFSIDFRSEYMFTHTLTTTSISVKLAKLLELSEEAVEKVYIGSLLHDLGKIAIPANILNYPGKLDEKHMQIMRTHVTYSANILVGYIDQEVCNIAIHHHEKLNGKGYPYGLCANDLSVNERITAIGDIFSALVEVRSYKRAFNKVEITEILKNNVRDGSLDSVIVQLAIDHYDDIITSIDEQCAPLIHTYHNISTEYEEIIHQFVEHLDIYES